VSQLSLACRPPSLVDRSVVLVSYDLLREQMGQVSTKSSFLFQASERAVPLFSVRIAQKELKKSESIS
jgi:hypothetical protein